MKINFKQINKRSTSSNFLIMATGMLICLIVVSGLIGGLYFLLSYETERMDDTSGVDTKMPSLDKDGMSYFISRQKERPLLSVPATPQPTASPETNKKI